MKFKFPASLQVIGRAAVDWWDGWLDMLLVIVVWLLAQITIVLGPPATFGLYYVVYHMINGQSMGLRGMIDGGRKHFGASWLWNALNLLVLVLLVSNYYFYGNFDGNWHYYVQGVFLIMAALWLMANFYALPFFFEQQEPRVWPAVRNGIFMTLATPFFSIVLGIFVSVIAAICAIVILPIFLSVPALIPFVGARAVQDRLEAFGLREREKTPKELERDESGKIKFPGSPEISERERQIKQ